MMMIDLVRITITARSPILQITFSLLGALARDSDAATPGHGDDQHDEDDEDGDDEDEDEDRHQHHPSS